MDFAAISNMLLEIFYIIIGIMMLNTAVLTLRDKNHKAKIGTSLFWALLGIIFIFGPYIPSVVVGGILVVIAVLTLTKQVKPGTVKALDEKFGEEQAKKLGLKVFSGFRDCTIYSNFRNSSYRCCSCYCSNSNICYYKSKTKSIS